MYMLHLYLVRKSYTNSCSSIMASLVVKAVDNVCILFIKAVSSLVYEIHYSHLPCGTNRFPFLKVGKQTNHYKPDFTHMYSVAHRCVLVCSINTSVWDSIMATSKLPTLHQCDCKLKVTYLQVVPFMKVKFTAINWPCSAARLMIFPPLLLVFSTDSAVLIPCSDLPRPM